MNWIYFILHLVLLVHKVTNLSFDPDAGTCLGTTSELSVGKNRLDHYERLYEHYQNCTIVKGNLELTGLEGTDLDMSFLQKIEVVTGYVVISTTYISFLSLDRLRVIRGRSLYDDQYALFVYNNVNPEDSNQHLRELRLPSLTEIVEGGVYFSQNSLCFIDTILWNDIFNAGFTTPGNRPLVIANNTPSDSCGVCDQSCPILCSNGNFSSCPSGEICAEPNCTKRCWGKSPSLCQKITQLSCHPTCMKGARCRGPRHEDCCDRECAAGCTGPSDTDCLVCRNVNDSGSCQHSCPHSQRYDPRTQSYIPNPQHKFHYSDYCVDHCPSNLFVEQNGCVKTCSFGYHDNGNGECIQCKNQICDKECYGVEHYSASLPGNASRVDGSHINSANIHHLKGCNIVKGSLYFNTQSFTSDNHTGVKSINDSQLELLRGIKKITGFLMISSWSKNSSNFSAFENLEEIGGVELYRDLIALGIHDTPVQQNITFNDHITSLGLRSLKTIRYGNVYISRLQNLCYDRMVNWTKIIQHPKDYRNFVRGLLSRGNKEECNNTTCHPTCDRNGCWGPGPSECLNCRDKIYNDTCYDQCPSEMAVYEEEGNKECQPCDAECKFCFGPGPENCSVCHRLRYEGACVNECPIDHYEDVESKLCIICNESCTYQPPHKVCTGPKSIVGEGGCNFCEYAAATETLEILWCLPENSSCPDGHYSFEKLDGVKHTCVPCYEGCSNCSGPTANKCFHSVPLPGPHLALIISVPLVIVLVVAMAMLTCYRRRQKKIKKKRQQSMKELGIDLIPDEHNIDPTARLMGPVTPSGVAPNQAQLRIVKENELRIGKILGSGAFGTVHKGFWIPDRAKDRIKVPVAIKVLRDESSQVASNEILDEAFLMASCKHPYLMCLLGISLSQQIMLITQLMPSGNLLDYVRDNKDKIGSQHLLNWSLQIAKGMCYLAEKMHLVHRDLAARNVLVKSPQHIRITDFGLAKLLDANENVYKAEGGKMPIKWLALESIQHRIFTHKSDVWSFGVTMWELLTFGKKPYDNVLAREVYDLLERGERLSQPSICTIDIYMLLIKCWTVDAEARPTFSELSEELLRMAKDPPRYIVIENEGMLKELHCPSMDDVLESLNEDNGDGFVITDAEMYQRQLEEGVSNGEISFRSQFDAMSLPPRRIPRHSTTSSQTFRSSGRSSGRFHHRMDSGRFGQSFSHDKRLDSVLTTSSNLSSVSSTLPMDAGNTLSPFLSPNNLENIDELLNVHGREFIPCRRDEYCNTGYRFLDAQDVFDPPSSKELSNLTEADDDCNPSELQPRLNRAREDSTTLRYSADPVSLHRQHSSTNNRISTSQKNFQQDDQGYLAPFAAANKKPEYLDPSHPPSPSSLQSFSHRLTRSGSAVTNPEYEAAFDFKEIDPNLDSDGYEVPITPGGGTEYENAPPIHKKSDSDSLYLLRNNSHCSESATSGKLDSDSGLQSDEEGEKRKTSVANPNYEWWGEVPNETSTDERTDYENIATDISKLNYGDDDIFNPNSDGDSLRNDPIQRTYSEPDSGVGIEMGADNIHFTKRHSNAFELLPERKFIETTE